MSFLDSLENNLKSLESREEGAGGREQELQRREAERREALAAQPHAERLKSGPYAAELMRQATIAGYAVRTKVRFTWIGTALRLEARDRKLELRPTADGVIAVLLEDNLEVRSVPADLDGDPAPLVRELLKP